MNMTPADSCLSCRIVGGLEEVAGGVIAETSQFHSHQDVAYPIPGQVIVAAKRHFTALDEMTDAEREELLPFLIAHRSAQREVLGIEHVYYFYNEDTRHHFHIWMVPRYEWMRQFGRSIQSVRPALRHAAETAGLPELETVASVAGQIREWMDEHWVAGRRTVK